ncbi:predicted protein [Naegleria gruberi]|uniref:Predicted protein n=1 Tax=Naegleria gruberi TaxID=5762 RepID=D2VR22_NAEGR|nr:uncharacterized protein NAEGRDRAFT_51578 [Naegleria gruberi]EFC40733.1 predicted protein [Naegleria gruberi]|eukprot:XP_002673477.1 predicted protein [Naegleria gruberi strain NEG-M]
MSFQHHPYNPNSSRTKRERFNWSSFMENQAEGVGSSSSSSNSHNNQLLITTTIQPQHHHQQNQQPTLSDASSSNNSHATKSSPHDNSILIHQSKKQQDETPMKQQHSMPRYFGDTPLMSASNSMATQPSYMNEHQGIQILPHPTTIINPPITQTNILNSPLTIQGNNTMPITIQQPHGIMRMTNNNTETRKSNNKKEYQQHGKEKEEYNIRLPSIFEWWHEDSPPTSSSSPSNNPFSFPPASTNTQFFDKTHSPPPSSSFVPISNYHDQHANSTTSFTTFRKKRHSPDSHAAISHDFTQIVAHQQLLDNSPRSQSPPNNNNINNLNNSINSSGRHNTVTSNISSTLNATPTSQLSKKRKTTKPTATVMIPSTSSIAPQQDSFLLQNEYEQFNKGEHEMQKKGRGEKIFKYSYYQYNNTSSNNKQ